MMVYRKAFTLLFLLTVCEAQESTDSNASYIDDTHATISNKVIDWSGSLDDTISGWLGYDETNTTIPHKSEDVIEKKVLYVDAFFQSNKFLDETDDTFVRVRFDSTIETKESNDFKARLSAQIPFIKSRQNFKFFINDLTTDNAKNILKEDEDDNKIFSDIGVHYFAPEAYGVTSRYSIGANGISPYVRARYNMPIEAGEWLIDPVQIFKYSTNDEFEEETNIYFDKPFKDLSLFRLQLHRKTQTEVDGMDYGLSLQYFWSNKENTGLRFTQSFFGNTEYPYIVDKSIEPPTTKSYGGLNNYITTISWRENIWRKWFYYEVSPTVNFHKDHDFEANYAIRVFFDFYFGHYY